MLARLVSVSEECRADSGVSAPGPGAEKRREEEGSGELVGTRPETVQGRRKRGREKERERERARGEGGEEGLGGTGAEKSWTLQVLSCCSAVLARTTNRKTCPGRASCERDCQVGPLAAAADRTL